VEVPVALLPAILDLEKQELSKDTLSQIEAWRAQFRQLHGFVVPGINFRVLSEAHGRDRYRVTVMEQDSSWGDANSLPVVAAILQTVEASCLSRVSWFLGHQETVNLLKGLNDPEISRIVGEPAALSKLVGLLQTLAERRTSIADLQVIVEKYSTDRQASVAWIETADFLTRRLTHLSN
jgi:type III secretory pathway component EscV